MIQPVNQQNDSDSVTLCSQIHFKIVLFSHFLTLPTQNHDIVYDEAKAKPT